MQPTTGNVFVEKIPREIKKNKFEYVEPHPVDNFDYRVTATTDVKVCRPGDFVIFNNSHEFKFEAETIIQVSEEDIVGVKNA